MKCLVLEGQDRLARRGGVQRQPAARLDEGAVGTERLLHQHGFGAVVAQAGQMGGLAELLHQPVQDRLRPIRVLRHAHGQVKETSQPGSCHVALGSGTSAQQIEIHEPPEQAVHRPRPQAELVGDLGEGQTGPRSGDGFENPDVPAQRTVTFFRARSAGAHGGARLEMPLRTTGRARSQFRLGSRILLERGVGHDCGRRPPCGPMLFPAQTNPADAAQCDGQW